MTSRGNDAACESSSESDDSEDSNLVKLRRLDQKSRVNVTLPSDSSSDESSVMIEKKKNSSTSKSRSEAVALKSLPCGPEDSPINLAGTTLGLKRSTSTSDISSTEREDKEQSQVSNTFDEFDSFWDDDDNDFFANSVVEGRKIQITIGQKQPQEERKEEYMTGNQLKEQNQVTPVLERSHSKDEKGRGGVVNPYNGVEKKTGTPSKSSPVPFLQSQDNGATSIDASPSKKPVPEQEPQSKSVACEMGDGDWLDAYIQAELAAVDKEMGNPKEPPTPNASEEPEWNEETIAEAFGFSGSLETAEDTSPMEHDEQRIGNVEENAAQPHEISMGEHQVTGEVHPDLYTPVTVESYREPMVHQYTITTRPISGRKCVPVNQVFDQYQEIVKFFKFAKFNQLQSAVANMIANSDDNLVVSAPTGAGKTAVFEMAMARFLTVDMQKNGRCTLQRKMMYVAPSKALCEERFEDWSARLAPLNLQVATITGDGNPGEAFRDIATAHVIITTPEKWDSLTRRWTENFFLFASVKLVLLDEIHLLADPSRGACLEAVLCRLKTIQRAAENINTNQETIQGSRYVKYTNTTIQ